MITSRYSQPSVRNSVVGGSLRVSGLPYRHMTDMSRVGTRRNTNHILEMLTAYYMGYGVTGIDGSVEMVLRDSNNIYNFSTNVPLSVVGSDTSTSIESRVSSSVASFLIMNGLTAPDVEIFLDPIQTLPPMLVGGVAKTNTYSVAAAPTVAGGAGVVRFYTDSNGDGTGTAPSEIELFTLQAYVVNTSAVYVIGSISVDTNRKYIDITMKSLAFTTGLAGLLSVITGASLANAANGTAVNCFVIVKK